MLPVGSEFYNAAKHRLQNGEKLIGSWVQLCSPMSAEILARAGFDFLLIDMEHAPGDFLNLLSQLHAIGKYPAAPIIRAPWNDFVTIKRILDVGAYGIHVPYVNTAEEACEAVRAVRYPPEGIRGIAGSPRACGYGLDGKNYYLKANREILLYIALETPKSIENLDEILQVDGVDGIFIGPMDLSAALGHVGDTKHPEVQKVIRQVEEKVLRSGKFLGTVAANYDGAKELFDRGYQYVVAMSDSIELSNRSYALMQQFKKDFHNEC